MKNYIKIRKDRYGLNIPDPTILDNPKEDEDTTIYEALKINKFYNEGTTKHFILDFDASYLEDGKNKNRLKAILDYEALDLISLSSIIKECFKDDIINDSLVLDTNEAYNFLELDKKSEIILFRDFEWLDGNNIVDKYIEKKDFVTLPYIAHKVTNEDKTIIISTFLYLNEDYIKIHKRLMINYLYHFYCRKGCHILNKLEIDELIKKLLKKKLYMKYIYKKSMKYIFNHYTAIKKDEIYKNAVKNNNFKIMRERKNELMEIAMKSKTKMEIKLNDINKYRNISTITNKEKSFLDFVYNFIIKENRLPKKSEIEKSNILSKMTIAKYYNLFLK